MDITVALQTAIDSVQKLRALAKKVEDAEIRMLLADLSNELADAKLEAANIKIELAASRSEVARLKQDLVVAEALREAVAEPAPDIREGAYVFAGQQGFYCTACYDTKRQRVLLAGLTGSFRRFGKWKCPSCQAIL